MLSTTHAYTRNMNWESEIDRYERHLRLKPASKAYIKNARHYLTKLGESLGPEESFLDPDEDRMMDWLLEVRDHGFSKKGPIAAASLNSVKGVIKACFRYLNEDETPPSIKKWVVGKNRSRVNAADLPTGDEVSFLAKALSPKYRAICLTIRYTGARPSEVLKLKRGDISPDFDLTFKDTKTGDHRTVPLRNPEGLAALKDWLSQANGLGYIFPSDNKPGEPLGYQALWLAMTRAAKRLGVKPIIPYALRHLRGTELWEEAPGYANFLMGHKSDATAKNYRHMNVKAAATALEEWEGTEETDVEEIKRLMGELNAVLERANVGLRIQPASGNPDDDVYTGFEEKKKK